MEFGESGLTKLTNGTVDTFVDGGSEKRKIYIHRACMTSKPRIAKMSSVMSELLIKKLIYLRVSNPKKDLSVGPSVRQSAKIVRHLAFKSLEKSIK